MQADHADQNPIRCKSLFYNKHLGKNFSPSIPSLKVSPTKASVLPFPSATQKP
jgi:hypothetical protein